MIRGVIKRKKKDSQKRILAGATIRAPTLFPAAIAKSNFLMLNAFRVGRIGATRPVFRSGFVGIRQYSEQHLTHNPEGVEKQQEVNGKIVTRTIPVTVERELPDPFVSQKQNRNYFWTYGIGVTLACVIIFNYEKTRSPIVNSTLYLLRMSDEVTSRLGDNIDFKSSWPWISGTLNTVSGDIDIEFAVKGSIRDGMLKLRASRTSKTQPFDVHEFTLTVDGEVLDLKQTALGEFL
ncbi:hypothetical protein PGUG_00135 [Meyerozyma guilliermondii ATCC 6260]|uniref:Uncharacterized protein n=1 Tax=Meyerozyma guilliermondii (strain ATCC 6260 / CBS 566 / DSM 6381 / JCM 1539 / NBRC 10279 / NRRL Y-324) TaxID=294746 RepID=A5DA30_PICGU|nr:uncharacterized protein PGUG_00135 [Meyerozyma guilliermondii ATCC 6260]EDK36037.2 hypothetical protein PGUG_00135 [Meyerozyma guilliermondii ATCC 6260]